MPTIEFDDCSIKLKTLSSTAMKNGKQQPKNAYIGWCQLFEFSILFCNSSVKPFACTELYVICILILRMSYFRLLILLL